MLPENLAPEQEMQTSDLDETRHSLETDFRTTLMPTTLDKLRIREDGHVDVEGHEIPYTQSFLEAAAKRIGMSLGYAYDIDFDLFDYNFNVRKQERSQSVTLCLNRSAAINIMPANYRPARTVDFLDAPPLNGNFWKFQQAVISDRGMEFNYLSPDAAIQAEPGDVIETGVRISNSETGYRGLKAAILAFRLACSNGAILADTLGTVRWNYDRRVTYGSSIRKFLEDLAKLQPGQQRLAGMYKDIVQRPLTDHGFVRLWRRLRSTLDSEQVDHVLEVDAATRRSFQDVVRHRPPKQDPEPTPWRIYDVHNRVTRQAQRLGFVARRRLEQIGGELISRPSLN